jgi:purine-binding chemotaxis protein CheW
VFQSKITAQADGGSNQGPVSTPQQFTIFAVDGEAFAVSLAEVKEIIRMPDVVRVPLAPGSLEGLTNLRGTVLPVVNTRCLFGGVRAPVDDATRVVILDHGQPIGIVVDRVISVVTIDADRIEDASRVETSVRSDLLRGVIKDDGALGLVMILEPGKLIEREFEMLALATRDHTCMLGDGSQDGTQGVVEQHDAGGEEIQLVSFEVAGQEYAFPITSVREIVQLPETITRVPRAAAGVLGVISLRDRLLPVVSLRRLFGLDSGQLAEHNRVAVISVNDGAHLVGLVLDRVNEVLRVRRSGIDAVPAMLAGRSDLSEVTAICRLNEGKRLVSILSAEAMFDRPGLERALDAAIEDAGGNVGIHQEDPAKGASRAVVAEDQFVVFRLMDEEFGVDIATVQEIVRVPAELAKVPCTDDFIRGVMNLRGAVIPLIDQRARFKLPPCEANDRQRIVVFTLGGIQTGFIVDSVSEVMRIRQDRIRPAPDMSENQRRLIRRVANLPESKRMILLLDAERLLDADQYEAVARAAA